jgi:hypothetical protein
VKEPTTFIANLEEYYGSQTPSPALKGSPSSRANKTMAARRSKYGEKTISKEAQAKLPVRKAKK